MAKKRRREESKERNRKNRGRGKRNGQSGIEEQEKKEMVL